MLRVGWVGVWGLGWVWIGVMCTDGSCGGFWKPPAFQTLNSIGGTTFWSNERSRAVPHKTTPSIPRIAGVWLIRIAKVGCYLCRIPTSRSDPPRGLDVSGRASQGVFAPVESRASRWRPSTFSRTDGFEANFGFGTQRFQGKHGSPLGQFCIYYIFPRNVRAPNDHA